MINYSLLDDAFPINGDKINKKPKKKEGQIVEKTECKPLQPPIYSVPSNCDNAGNFRKVISDSMSMNKPVDDFKKDGVRAYDYDEMDAYLNITELNKDTNNINANATIKTNNRDDTDEYRTTPFLAEYLRSLRNNFKKPISESNDIFRNIEQFTNNNFNNSNNSNNLKVDVNLYNLFLFIFLGIIIIVLIDQITKLISLNTNNNN